MTAVAPASAIVSRPSGNGKKASEAATVPLSGRTGLHGAEARGVDPAHLTGADPDRLAVSFAESGIDDRV